MNTDTAASHPIETLSGMEMEAAVADVRRVQHLSAIVLESLGPDPDRETLVREVLVELYEAHPAVRLEDSLELVHLIECPAGCSTNTAIRTVIEEACEYLVEWGRLGHHQFARQASLSDS
ncbi:hypothetical protein [Halosimplex carlsbadense]|uniref:hypothetical protein n=1 Tax=Halosimplex carlsbadense TaxID=171164 RepID=UPI001268E6E9|nr:hypothetical protein [Halosimplex carlsbadense]